MTDEPRTPLGDLNPSDYYADGHDATSTVLVEEDEAEPEKPAVLDTAQPLNHVSPTPEFNFNTEPPTAAEGKQDQLMSKAELSSLLLGAAASSLPLQQDELEAGLFHKCHDGADAEGVGPADIEIWESGSAKDESGEMDGVDSIFADV